MTSSVAKRHSPKALRVISWLVGGVGSCAFGWWDAGLELEVLFWREWVRAGALDGSADVPRRERVRFGENAGSEDAARLERVCLVGAGVGVADLERRAIVVVGICMVGITGDGVLMENRCA
jgi:hypothetical protein